MDFYRIFFLSSILIISSLVFKNTSAAPFPVSGVSTSQVDPGNVRQGITRAISKPMSTPDKLTVPTLTQSLNLGEAKQYSVVLKKIDFENNTAISSAELEKIFTPYYGKNVTLAQFLDLIKQTTNLYREQGYILSQAFLPAQDIDKHKGIIKVGIVEGYVNSINIVAEGIPYTTKLLLRQYGERMMAERPIKQSTLERYSLLANDLPGSTIKVVFAPAKNKPGAADVEFVSDDAKVFGVEFFGNNRGTRLLGPVELSLSGRQYNGLYGNESLLNVIKTSDTSELQLYLFSHRQPLNSDGLALTLSGSRTETNPNYLDLPTINKSSLKTPGLNDNLSARLEYPWIRSREHNLLVSVTLDGSDNLTTILKQTLYRERLRTVRAGFIYDWLDTWFFGIVGINLAAADFSQGLAALDSFLDTKAGTTTRPNVKRDYNKVSGTVSRSQPLPYDFFVRLLGTWQYAFDELVSSEEFGYGGRTIGLGYDSYEISGDHGISGKAEFGYTIPINQLNITMRDSLETQIERIGQVSDTISLTNTEIFAFYDGGRIWNIDHKVSAQKEHDSAISTGLGLRGTLFKYVIFEGYVAKPLSRIVANEIDRKPRYFLSVGLSFR